MLGYKCVLQKTQRFLMAVDEKRKRDFAAKKSCEILFLSGKIRAAEEILMSDLHKVNWIADG